MYLSRTTAIAVAVIVIAICHPAFATKAVNLTTGELLFYDDYEGLGNNVSHASYRDTSGDYDPIVSDDYPGIWFVGETDAYQIQVTDSTSGFDPGAYEEDNYLRVDQRNGYNNVRCNFKADQTSGQIHFETMFYFHHQEGYSRSDAAILSLMNGGGLVSYIYARNTGVIANRTSSDWGVSTGQTFTVDAWNYISADYVIGEETYSLTVNDQTVSGLSIYYSGTGASTKISGVRIGADVGCTVYYDAIVVPRLPGDANGDNVVNEKDAQALAENWLAEDASWKMGDFNNDNVVNDLDATIMAVNWLNVFGGGSPATVPEPNMLTLLMLIGLTTLLLRRR